MSLVITGAKDGATGNSATPTDEDHLESQVGETWSASEQLTINATMFETGGGPIASGSYLDLRGATVKVVWVPQDEDYSDVVFRWEGPNA